jgi:rod shape determining protein RodA
MTYKSSLRKSRFDPKSWFKEWPHFDWMLLLLVFAINGFGGWMIRSAELNQPVTDWWQFWLFGGIGAIFSLVMARVPPERYRHLHWLTYGLNIALLLAVIVGGTKTNGAQRWINIAGFNLQPSEFAKIAAVLTLAAILHRRTANTLPAFLQALIITAPTWFLVFIQPDLGTSLVFGAIALGMLYWANANPCWLFLLASPVVSAVLFNIPWAEWVPKWANPWMAWTIVMAVAAWFSLPFRWISAVVSVAVNYASGEAGHVFWEILKPYQKARLITFLDPEKFARNEGYHIVQSKIAIGAGGLWGQGINQGTQTQLNFIPEQHTDFIFSAIAEETGFIGCAILLIAFWLVCWRLLKIAQTAEDNFGSLVAIGMMTLIAFQTTINIGMTMGIAPVVGIPLPWTSYGRSALIAYSLGIGLVQSVANHRRIKKSPNIR